MARRSRTRRVIRVGGKDYVWVTAIGGFSVAENSTTVALASAGTWEANALNFERATLLRIRGYITVAQTVASSTTSPPLMSMAIFKGPLTYTAGDFDPLVSSDYDATDVLWTWGTVCTAGTGSRAGNDVTTMVDVKAKRKMDSAEQILLAVAMGADAGANPIAFVQFVLRLLINRA